MSMLLGRAFRRKNTQTITVVSGLPRSGTSMMMQMLHAGGINLLVDDNRQPDINNPNGYYEYERVKDLETGDHAWLTLAQGKAVKVIAALVPQLPPDYVYRIIFLLRDLDEVIGSQKRMLQQTGQPTNVLSDEELAALYVEHLATVHDEMHRRREMQVLEVDYHNVIADPPGETTRIQQFLGRRLDTAAMVRVVDPTLYRTRTGI